MKIIPLNGRQQLALSLIGPEWGLPPRGFTSATLLSLRDRGLVEMRRNPGFGSAHAATLPYNCRAYQYRLKSVTQPQLVIEKKDSKFSAVLRTMPPLRHSIPGQPFDVNTSEVIQWIVRQPEALECIFDIARVCGRIAYDKSTGRWAGVPSPEVKS